MGSLSSPTPDATTGSKGKVQLAGNLGGTAASPTVVGVQAGVIVQASLSTTAGEIGGSWTAWTPTLANFTIGNGTQSWSYKQQGKVVNFKGVITLGTTSSIGTGPTFTLPVTSVATLGALHNIGDFVYDNNGGSGFNGFIGHASTTTGKFYIWDINNNLGQVTATNPTAFATSHKLFVRGVIEAA